jgi:hypothetical protein
MRQGIELALTVLLAWQLSTKLAVACSCAPQPPPPEGTVPALRLPHVEGKNSAVFLGVVDDVFPTSTSDYKISWRQRYGEELSYDKPPSVERMRDFMLYLWHDTFSQAERQRIMKSKSIDDLESAVESFWMTPRRVRFRIKEMFAGAKRFRSVLYTGLGGGDCGVEFRAGESWLVDAYQDEAGRWIAGICSVTMPETEAEPVLTALRGRATSKEH